MEEEMEEGDLPIFGDDLAGNHFKDKYPSVHAYIIIGFRGYVGR